MKKFTIISTTILICLAVTFCNNKTSAPKKSLTTTKEKFSYAIGQEIGMSLMQLKDEVELDILFQAIRDTLSGQKSLISAEEARAVKDSIFKGLQEKMQVERSKQQESNKTEGEEFLAKNKSNPGVITTESGLQYIVQTEGAGAKPTKEDKVRVHYKGSLLDGTEFDSSYKRGQPAEFQVGGVIPGWTEALQLMKVGSKYKLFIPSSLAYGANGAGNAIPPNATLIFEVELMDILK